jgi:hypothetical protein
MVVQLLMLVVLCIILVRASVSLFAQQQAGGLTINTAVRYDIFVCLSSENNPLLLVTMHFHYQQQDVPCHHTSLSPY